MWGVCNMPLPWRTKRYIPKINFGVMRNGITFFLIWKMFMQNWLYLYWNRERVMRNVLTFYLNRKRVMQNRLSLYWNRERVMRNVLTFYLNRERVMQNDIAGISVGAYCIRLIKTASKETYDQKSMYMWGVFNTPLPWRTKRSIPKINFGVMQNGMILFLIWKMFMQNRLYLYWNRERVMRNVLTFYLNRKMVMRNGWKISRKNVLERYFWGTYFERVFFFVTKRKHSGFVVKSGVQNRKNLFEDVYSSSPLRMDALSENKQ